MADTVIDLGFGAARKGREAPSAETLSAIPTGTDKIALEQDDNDKVINLDFGAVRSAAPSKTPAEKPFSPLDAPAYGTAQVGVQASSTAEMFGSLLGVEALKRAGAVGTAASEEAAAPFLPRVMGVQDVGGVSDAGQLAYNMLGTNAPQMAVVGGASLLHPAVGVVASYVLNAGDVYKEMKDKGYDEPAIAAAVGVPIALLDAFSMGSLMSNVGGKRVITKAGAETGTVLAKAINTVMQTMKAGGIEGGTELLQDVIQIGATSAVAKENPVTPENAIRLVNAALGGFIGGGTFHAVGSAIKPLSVLEREQREQAATPAERAAPSATVQDLVETPQDSTIDISSLTAPAVDETITIPEQQAETSPVVSSPAAELAPLGEEEATGPAKDYSKATAPSIGRDVAEIVRSYSPEQMIDALTVPASTLKGEVSNLTAAMGELEGRASSVAVREKVITNALEKSGMDKEEAKSTYDSYKPVFTLISQRAAPAAADVVVRFEGNDAAETEQLVRDVLPGQNVLVEPPADGVGVEKAEDGSYRIEAEGLTQTANALAAPVIQTTYESLPPTTQEKLQTAWKASGTEQSFGEYLADNIALEPKLYEAVSRAYKIAKPSLPYQDWVKDGGRRVSSVPDATPAQAVQADEDMAFIDAAVKETDKEFKADKARFREDLDKHNGFYRTFYSLLRFADINKHIKSLQAYLTETQAFSATKSRVLYRSDTRLMEWDRRGSDQGGRLGKFLFDITQASDKLERKLTPQELKKFVTKHQLDHETQALAMAIDADFRSFLDNIEQAVMEDAQRRNVSNPEALAQELAAIKADFDKMRNRNYFPLTRFGPHVAIVRARAATNFNGKRFREGQIVEMQTFESALERNRMVKEMERVYDKGRFAVASDKLVESEYAFLGLPPAVLTAIQREVGLTPEQVSKMKEYMAQVSPGMSARKHFMRRESIAGFSTDAKRVYRSYFFHGASHLARLKHYWKMLDHVSAIGKEAGTIQNQGGKAVNRREVYQFALRNYRDVMNPRTEGAVVKSVLFHLTFILNMRHAVYNVLTAPLVSYNEIVARAGGLGQEGKAAVVMATAATDARKAPLYAKSLSAIEQVLMQRGVEEGVLNQSYASDMAESGRGDVVGRLLDKSGLGESLGHLLRKGMRPFSWTEEWGRRTTFLTSLRMNEHLAPDARYKEAMDVVQKTFSEFGAWNRAEILRGYKGLPFVFRSYTYNLFQHMLHDKGGRRTFLMLLAMAGLGGIPFAKDFEKLLSAVITLFNKLNGEKDPYFDAELEVRRAIKEYTSLPVDAVMHGMGSRTLGMYDLANMVGLPMPLVDFGSGLGLGQMVPGVQAAVSMLEGRAESDVMKTIAQDAKDSLGALAGVAMTGYEAMLTRNPNKFAEMLSVWRNVSRAYEAANTGFYKDSKGNPVLPVDPSRPEHAGELIAMALGFSPTRLVEKQEANWAAQQGVAFYRQWREHAIQDYVDAKIGKSPAALKDAREDIKRFNRDTSTVPNITIDEVDRAVRARAKNRRLREKGMPLEKRYTKIHREVHKAYQESETD